MGQAGVLMSQKEVARVGVIQRALKECLARSHAAQLLRLSVRQVKRLCRRVNVQGAQGLVSRRRGRAGNRRVATSVREHYLGLVREHFADFGPLLAPEYLKREHGFAWSVETLRGWMIEGGQWRAKRRRAQRVQIDGSHHDWFEGRSGKCCLIAFIDDATGRVLGGQFFEQQTTQGYLSVRHGLVQRHDAPLALYSDRHGIFTKHDPEDTKPSQFERALLQLDIEPICAHSPQARGRVERQFQTQQDRMCKAMRPGAIDNIEQANSWLAEHWREHIRRFAVAPHSTQDMHRAWTGTTQALADICSRHRQRQLSAQGACKFEGAVLQLQANQAQAPKARAMVDIAQHADGSLHLSYCGQSLAFHSFGQNVPARSSQSADNKTISVQVDKLRDAERERLRRLAAELAFQQSQRQRGVFKPDTPPIVPRAGAARPGLRPARAAPATT